MKVRSLERLDREEVYLSSSPWRHCLIQFLALHLLCRAAERYADLSPDEYRRRRQRGWGDGVSTRVRPYFRLVLKLVSKVDDNETAAAGSSTGLSPTHAHVQLHIQTDLSSPLTPDIPPDQDVPLPSIGEVLSPTRLSVHQFGSRFLPHTSAPIRCILPVLNNALLLVGHDDGLSVLNMFPKEWTEEGLVERGPNDADAHHIWTGEGCGLC